MTTFIIIGVIILVIAVIVYIEYKNEKEYKKEQADKQKRQIKRKESSYNTRPSERHRKKVEPLQTQRVDKKPMEQKPMEQKSVDKKTAEVKETIRLPDCHYPAFNHARLTKMGFSKEETDEFLQELIEQIDTQLPVMEDAILQKDYTTLDSALHTIKGSTSTIGTGGISDLIDAFNLYIHKDKEPKVISHYMKYFKHYFEALKTQYPV